jgi:hypothetical protein
MYAYTQGRFKDTSAILTAMTLSRENEDDDDQVLVTALHPQTPKHIRGGWSRYTDTSEPLMVMGLKIWSDDRRSCGQTIR